ncbi:MAG TPA: SDR family oxidoreductase [Actinospica sp.]|nr:SDR family oxidoreductase [Actinospica sp.]
MDPSPVPLNAPAGLCLVTGATGYVGGRLVPRLLEAGYAVRCMTRSRASLRDQPWFGKVEVVEADAADAATTAAALDGVRTAYYLIHSMLGGPRFEQADRRAAHNFAERARDAGLGRLVYLGGLAPAEDGQPLSVHMRSRAEVGRILLESGVPTVVLRAAVIIGSGSASFEMLRYLTERLPAMVTPTWVDSKVQPIAVRDVLRYLAAAAALPGEVAGSFDIGGPEVLTYREMMQRYAAVAGLAPRRIIPVPVLSPRLSSHWVGLVTPIPSALARPLIDSLRHDAICHDRGAVAKVIPDPPEGLVGFEDAVDLALRRVREAAVVTRWSSGSVPGAPSDPLPTDPSWSGGSLYTDLRLRATPASPAAVWRAIEAIGGETGWYSLPVAWQARGLIDRAFGGVGLRRGRRDPVTLRVGDAVDFWRVEELLPGRMLRLRAEMRLPGLAWLELHVDPAGDGALYRQRALFYPRGLAGQLYWWSIKPFHGLVFGAMARNLTRRALEAGAAPAAVA